MFFHRNFKTSSFKLKLIRSKIICFWQLHFLLEHLSCIISRSPLLFRPHQAEYDTARKNIVLAFSFLFEILTSCYCHLFCKNLRLVSSTNFATSTDSFNNFFCFRIYIFIYVPICHFIVKSTTNTPCFCLLTIKKLDFQEVQRVKYEKFFC